VHVRHLQPTGTSLLSHQPHDVARRLALTPDSPDIVCLAPALPAMPSSGSIPEIRCHPRLTTTAKTPDDDHLIACRALHSDQHESAGAELSTQSLVRANTVWATGKI
jgi:hypothetical protein